MKAFQPYMEPRWQQQRRDHMMCGVPRRLRHGITKDMLLDEQQRCSHPAS